MKTRTGTRVQETATDWSVALDALRDKKRAEFSTEVFPLARQLASRQKLRTGDNLLEAADYLSAASEVIVEFLDRTENLPSSPQELENKLTAAMIKAMDAAHAEASEAPKLTSMNTSSRRDRLGRKESYAARFVVSNTGIDEVDVKDAKERILTIAQRMLKGAENELKVFNTVVEHRTAGYSNKELANMLGMTLETFDSTLSHARAKIDKYVPDMDKKFFDALVQDDKTSQRALVRRDVGAIRQ